MANVNIRIDDDLKRQAEAIFSQLGLNMSTAMTIFLKESVRYRGIPFELRLSDEVADDLFCSSLVDEYEKSDDKGDFISLEEAAKICGVDIDAVQN